MFNSASVIQQRYGASLSLDEWRAVTGESERVIFVLLLSFNDMYEAAMWPRLCNRSSCRARMTIEMSLELCQHGETGIYYFGRAIHGIDSHLRYSDDLRVGYWLN